MPPQTWPPTSSRRVHLVPLECKKNLSAPRAPPQILLGELAALLYTPSWWGWGCLPPLPKNTIPDLGPLGLGPRPSPERGGLAPPSMMG